MAELTIDELLALMTAQIYAQRFSTFMATTAKRQQSAWDKFRADAMRASLTEARELWALVRERQSG